MIEMPIVQSDIDTKLKLVTLQAGLDGVQRQRTTTLSNIVSEASNDNLMAGAKALIQFLQTAPAAIVKVTEVTLTEQV